MHDIAKNKSLVLFCGAGINCSGKVRLSCSDLIEYPFRLALNHIAREKDFNNDLECVQIIKSQ